MEEQEGQNIIRINLLQTSMTLGTYLGAYIILVYLVAALTVKYSILSLLSLPLLIGIPFVAFFLIRRFRSVNVVPDEVKSYAFPSREFLQLTAGVIHHQRPHQPPYLLI